MAPPRKRGHTGRSLHEEKSVRPAADSGVQSTPAPGGIRAPAPRPLDHFTRRLATLVADSAADATRPPEQLSAELAEALEELRVAAEELQRQNALLDQAAGEVVDQMQRYRELFDFAPDGYLVLDASGVIQEANLAAAELLRIDAGGLIGKPLVVLTARSDRPRLLRLLRDATRDAEVHETELLVERRGAGSVPVSVRLSAPSARGGRSLRCLLRDVSELRANELRLEDALQRQRDSASRLREMDDVKNAFLLAVSHDLRGPLAAIVMLAQLLAEQPDQSPQRLRRMAASIAANTARVERVQHNLLDLDRLARHAVVLVRRSVRLDDLVERAVAVADATDHPVSIKVEVAHAKLDAAVVGRILDNLLSNVTAHTPGGTEVEISVVPWDQGVLLTVADNGPGIASERRRDVFKSFPSPTESPVASRTGMGLGLHLVARFAALHGGRVWVEETPGGGASFRVLLRDRP